MIDQSSPTELDSRRLSARLQRVLADSPSATALWFGENQYPWAYFAEAAADLDRLLDGFPDAGRIGIVVDNAPGLYAAVVATAATSRQIVTLSAHVGDVQLGEDVESLRPDVVIARAGDWERAPLREAASRIGAIPAVSTAERPIAPMSVGWTPAPARVAMDDIAIVMMTSGTTGRPKHVSLTRLQVVAALAAAGTPVDEMEVELPNGVALLWSSLSHIGGLYFVLSHAAEGRAVALMERFDIAEWTEVVRRHRPSYVRLPPAAMRMVMQSDVPVDTFESVIAVGVGTSACPPELSSGFESRYGVPVLTMYGATEFAGAVTRWSLSDHKKWAAEKRGSVGRALRGVELRIVDPQSGNPLAPGDIGLLEARGDQLKTADGAWVRTTDLAYLDQDGFLFIQGRADDAINRGGFKIPPAVIEDALRDHPAVRDVAALGTPDERLGEVPIVAVSLRGEATEEVLRDHLAQRLTRYQMPVALYIFDELPQTPSMKVSRPRLRAMIAERDESSFKSEVPISS